MADNPLRQLMLDQGWTAEDLAGLARKPLPIIYRFLADETTIPKHVLHNLTAMAKRGRAISS